MSSKGNGALDKLDREMRAKYPAEYNAARRAYLNRPAPEHPIARPVYALEEGESMSRQIRVCRALKTLYGPGITWHQVGYHVVYFTPGDMCGCHDCHALIQTVIQGPHGA